MRYTREEINLIRRMVSDRLRHDLEANLAGYVCLECWGPMPDRRRDVSRYCTRRCANRASYYRTKEPA